MNTWISENRHNGVGSEKNVNVYNKTYGMSVVVLVGAENIRMTEIADHDGNCLRSIWTACRVADGIGLCYNCGQCYGLVPPSFMDGTTA
jgi:hypothetical protein